MRWTRRGVIMMDIGGSNEPRSAETGTEEIDLPDTEFTNLPGVVESWDKS